MRKTIEKADRLRRQAGSWLNRKRLQRTEPDAMAILEEAGLPGRSLTDVQAMVREKVNLHGVDRTAAALDTALGLAPRLGLDNRSQRVLFVAGMRALSFAGMKVAAEFGERHLERLRDPRAIHSLVVFQRRTGNFDRAFELLQELPRDEFYATNAALLYDRTIERRLDESFSEALRAARANGDREVLAVAERLFAAIERGSKVPAYRLLRRLLENDFRGNKLLAGLIISHAEEMSALPDKDVYIALTVCDTHLYQGSLTRAIEALSRLAGENPRAAPRLAKIQSLHRLLEGGFVHRPTAEPYMPVPARALYVLHNSLPYDSGGYATRSHGLLSGLVRHGWKVSGVTRLGYPQDVSKHRDKSVGEQSQVDQVTYHRLHGEGGAYGTVMDSYLAAFADQLLEKAQAERPEILHACSNHINGLAANAVARAVGIKSVYEVRGLWEITRISRQPEWHGTEYYNLMSRLELQAAQEADAVICITNALRDEMVRRGVPVEKITVVPNGVDVERFVPRARNQALAERLGLAGKKVIGYVGSVVGYEGLDLLLRAIVILRDRGVPDFGVLIVGDGAALDDLQALSVELGLSDLVTFTGRVPHEEVEDHYSVIDVAPFPRKSLPVTEMVSPLKPFEAMAMEKIVVSSNVAALAEIVQDGVNGFLFQKDDVEDLAAKLQRVLAPDFENDLRPREWVVANRSWQRLSLLVDDVYKKLTHRLEPAHEVYLNDFKLGPEVRATYDAYREKMQGAHAHLRRDDYARWSYVLDRIPAGGSLLDIGVGVGQFLNAAAARGDLTRVVGVDITVHTEFLRLHRSFSIEKASVAKLPFGDGEFDSVTCMETIEHLLDDDFLPALAELRRVCRRQLLVTVPFREEILSPGHFRRFDFAELGELFPAGRVTLFRKVGTVRGRASFWALIEEDQS